METSNPIPTEQAIFTKAWNLLKEYRTIGSDPELWDAIVIKANRIYHAGSDPATEILAHGLTVAVLKYLEEKAKTN